MHGSAPDIAGNGKANPMAAILTAAMMLEFLGESASGRADPEGRVPTPAIGGSTAEIGEWSSHGGSTAMPITPTEKIWMNGELVDWDDAKIHVLTHSLHYGMGVFEGIRGLRDRRGPRRCSGSPSTSSGCSTPPRS